MTDSYKATHWVQYPEHTEHVYSYLEARKPGFGGDWNRVLFFGLQYILKKYFCGERVTLPMIRDAKDFWTKHLGNEKLFNEHGWNTLLEKHGGRLSVRIKAVPEGEVVEVGNVLLSIENTDPEFYWLTNYLETLLVQVWYPCTVASISMFNRELINDYLIKTGTPSLINFKLHDFGYRGVSSPESAAIGGAAHLLNFLGTDTAAGMELIEEYYAGVRPLAFSVPASEHSTITAWGKSREYKAFENMLDRYPEGIVACVSDSFDIFEACKTWAGPLKEKVLARNGTLVVRPDSGDATKVIPTVLELLSPIGFTVNSKGYKVLDDHVRVLQGDGINHYSMGLILEAVAKAGWSTDNILFGMGRGLLQDMNRDVFGFAMKCSNVTIGGAEQYVFKEPVTDPGKKSKKGRQLLIWGSKYSTPELQTVSEDDNVTMGVDQLQTVFENGELVVNHSFKDVLERADQARERFASHRKREPRT